MEKVIEKGIREKGRVAKRVVSRIKPTKKAVPRKKRGRKRVVPLVPPTLFLASGFSDLRRRRGKSASLDSRYHGADHRLHCGSGNR